MAFHDVMTATKIHAIMLTESGKPAATDIDGARVARMEAI